MIIQVRGTGGSGKSYIGFKMLENYPPIKDIVAPPMSQYNHRKTKDRIIGYELPGDLAVLGTYRFKNENTYSGGLEAWTWKGSAQDMREFIAESCHKYSHVYFEGLLPALSIKPYLELGRRLVKEDAKALPFVHAFLNTPREVCHQRILSRNGGKEIKVETTVNYDWKRMHTSIKPQFDESEFWSPYVPYERSFEWVEEAFLSAGWDPTG